jgi:uncharacterized protein
MEWTASMDNVKVTREIVEGFLAQEALALAGASRGGKKFGNTIFKDLSVKGYRVHLVHPDAREIDGAACVSSLEELPEAVGGLVLVVPPAQSEKLVREAHAAGIPRVWMQQGAESPTAIEYCRANGMEVVHGECIMMFAEPVHGLHSFHRWVSKVFGKLPR